MKKKYNAKRLLMKRDEKGNLFGLFSYRGCDYTIGYNTEENPSYLHRFEQKKIDSLIEKNAKMKGKVKRERPAQEGFDLFWKYLDT